MLSCIITQDSRRRLRLLASAAVMLCMTARAENKYLQHNLVSDIPGKADFLDADLTNPWGMAASPTSPIWVSNNHSGTAKVYGTSGQPAPLVVHLQAPGSTAPASPTGVVFNGSPPIVL